MHNISENIEFGNITKDEFTKFLNALKAADEPEHKNEEKDGFLDLYNYWEDITFQRGGKRRFKDKILSNLSKIL